MTAAPSPYVEIDGRRPEVEDLIHPALVNFGHFTAMQVRGGAVRGLHKHLRRLRVAHVEMFGTEIETEAIRSHMRSAVSRRANSYLRVTLFEPHPGSIRTMSAVRPPLDAPTTPQSLKSISYSRPVPHIKHVGSFAQIFHSLKAREQGFDDALLTSPDGEVSETTRANIGFYRGHQVVWPKAPSLHRITWQILDEHLGEHGFSVHPEHVALRDVARFDGAFLANSIGVVGVGRIDGHRYPPELDMASELSAAYAAAPWDEI
ncbi:aminotransferase class IV [Cryobacterium fucosi]|uniref:Class IV aminotransferase n=1 Tax=Cryobacterium fucosi TaxID=1259157 RepID=A0A4R9BHA6_9MICO|nr:aminotransferase class IV [Cryobacterium fucosi]TFD82774.1 class IV aminotransferase [Cryobacterium fucosi]